MILKLSNSSVSIGCLIEMVEGNGDDDLKEKKK